MTYIAPIEGEALLLLRKKEIRRIEEMRREQESTMQQLISTHYADMEAQQKQAIIDMEELAELINFDNVTASEQEREEAMKAEDINVLTYGKEEINEVLNEKLTPSQLEKEKEEAVAPTPEVGDYGYVELGQDVEEVEFELEEPKEPEEQPEEPAAESEEGAETEAYAADENATGADDEWGFIDALKVDEKDAQDMAIPTPVFEQEEDRENKAVSRAERKAYKQRMKEEAKAKKEAEKARLEQEKRERKERMKRLDEENKRQAAAMFAPTAPRAKKAPSPFTPSAQEILAPKPPVEQAEKRPDTISSIHVTGAGAQNTAGRPRTFVPRSYTPLSITPDNVHDVLGDKKKKKK